MIELKNITKSYNVEKNKKNTVLNDISLSIEAGQMLAVTGRSGAGKTTLLNIIAGFQTIDLGKYYFNLNDISEYTSRQRDDFRSRNIGIIVQDYAVINELTAKENIMLAIRNTKFDADEINDYISDVSQKLGIKKYLKTKCSILSGGEKQRVAIARALVKNPKVILADEPTGSLDLKSEKIVLQILKDLQKQGHTIIISTHSNIVANSCDSIFDLENYM